MKRMLDSLRLGVCASLIIIIGDTIINMLALDFNLLLGLLMFVLVWMLGVNIGALISVVKEDVY